MKDSTQCFVVLKVTTDRHEAPRGLFETAELHVSERYVVDVPLLKSRFRLYVRLFVVRVRCN